MQWITLLPVLFFSVVLHECAHGYVASRCGDDTARYAGRITLNPVPHIDPFGSIFLPLLLILTKSPFLFAWAKPVPVNPRNFRNPGRDDVLVSLAGPATNLALALMFTVLGIVAIVIMKGAPFLGTIGQAGVMLARYGILINLILATFNLVPIPPLDGSHILRELLPYEAALKYDKVSRYGFIILLLLVVTPVFRLIFLPAHLLFGVLWRLMLAFA
jgi:Zn-dependent protease